MGFYEDSKYAVIRRKWFGRPLTRGGDAAAGIALTASGTTKTVITQYLPKGPINVEKVGVQVIATLSSADNSTGSVKRQVQPVKFYKGTTSTPRQTLIGNVSVTLGDGSRTALWAIASQGGSSLSSQEVEAGKKITVFLATPTSDNGTAAGATGTVFGGGTLSYFIDYSPKFDQSKWEKSKK